nr:O-antigen ligase family protein [Lachnospiraceae bacterium]
MRSDTVKKKKNTSGETGSTAKSILIWLVKLYVFLLMAVYPLYYKDKYYDIDVAKWNFFKYVSFSFAAVIAIVFLRYLGCFIAEKKLKEFLSKTYKKLTMTDRFVLGYLLVCCISTLITPYRQNLIWGVDGWYMGFIAQLSFVLIYFLVSRYWRWDPFHLFIFLLTAFAVFFLAVIMRFRIDPLKMYEGLDEYNIQHFLSTLGQTTWYSSYMCIMAPLGLVGYWCAEKKLHRIALGVFCVISFMSFVTQNSDSAYVAVFGIFFMLFWISFESDGKFLRFLECVILVLGAFKLIGLLQLAFKERAVALDRLSIFMSRSVATLFLLVAAGLLYILLRAVVFRKTDFHIEKIKKIRGVMLILLVLGVLGMIIYIFLNTTGRLPESLSSDSNYLVFNDAWGNNRGVSWRCTVDGYIKADPLRKLFGVGPDSFAEYIYGYYQADLDRILGGHIAQICAHNEWLNTLLNLGILGFIAYLGIFVSSFK